MTHLISYYITIILIISVLYQLLLYTNYIIRTYMEATVTVCVGLHKLSVCVLVVHLEYRAPEQLTMKYWHVQ